MSRVSVAPPRAFVSRVSSRVSGGRRGVRALGGGSGASTTIEVERKFSLDVSVDELRARVESCGGREQGNVEFTDTYYDTPGCVLASSDVWLRARDDAWEIKLPVPGDERRSGGERSVFREVEGPAATLRELLAVLDDAPPPENPASREDDDPAAADAALRDAMEAREVRPFATFSTRRAKFRLDDAVVDVDAASFGHVVVEVEVLCAAAAEIPAAEAKVRDVARRLGLSPMEHSGGKLETFIRRNRPAHLEALVAAGFLEP